MLIGNSKNHLVKEKLITAVTFRITVADGGYPKRQFEYID